MDLKELIGGTVLAYLLISTFWAKTAAPPTLGDSTAVPTTNDLQLIAPKDHGDGLLQIRSPGGAASLTVSRGWVYADADQRAAAKSAGYTFAYTRYRFLWDADLDAGAFGGMWSGTPSFQSGLRLSPVRLLWGTLALDALVTHEASGAGISIYAPAGTLPWAWADHVGLEVGQLWPFAGGASSRVLGLSFSIRPY